MSLVQHVSATEGIDRERDEYSDVESLLGLSRTESRPELSYDPLPEGAIGERLETIGAYEVSTRKRAIQVLVGVLSCISASGIVFGFAALKTILVEEGVYRKWCTPDELDSHIKLCFLQDQCFICASVTTNISALVVGATLDRYGPRVCGLISSFVLAIGSLCMAFASSLPFDALIVGNFFLALGGTFTFVPSFHLANAFPKYQGIVLALITGAFDASAAVFLLFRVVYEQTDGRFNLKWFFLIYLVVPVLLFLAQLFIMPSHSYETRAELTHKIELAEDPDQDMHSSDDELPQVDAFKVRTERTIQRKRSISEMSSLMGTQEQRDKFEKHEIEKKTVSGVWGVLHGLPAYRQMMTPWFILITMLTVLQMARFNFFIATIWTQYKYMLQSSRLATQVNQFFDIALPIGGVATVPFIGLLLDNTSTATTLSLIVLMSTVIGVLGAVPTMRAAYANVLLFCIFRPLYYSAMSDYAAKVFGFQTFGRVYGAIICLSGLFTFTQAGLQTLVHSIFEEDPGPVNFWLAGIGLVVGIMLVMYVDTRGRVVQIQQAEEDERRSLRPRGSRSSLRSVPTAGERTPLLRPRLDRHLSTVEEDSEHSEQSERSSVRTEQL